MTGNNFFMCQEGQRLYMLWSQALDDHQPGKVCRQLRKEFNDHRRICGKCTPPREKEEEK